jgi:hypothetical protein
MLYIRLAYARTYFETIRLAIRLSLQTFTDSLTPRRIIRLSRDVILSDNIEHFDCTVRFGLLRTELLYCTPYVGNSMFEYYAISTYLE